MPSGRPKGGTNKYWTPEKKEKIVLYHIENEIGMDKCAKKFGISQRELARQTNMDCAEVSRIEAGKRLKLNVLYLKGIAETLKLSMVDLMNLLVMMI